MTAIVGLVSDGRVWLGCDSATVDDEMGLAIRNRSWCKILTPGPEKGCLLGVAGSTGVERVLRTRLQLPSPNAVDQASSFLSDVVLPELDEALVDENVFKLDEHRWTLLLGFRGRLFKIYSDLGVEESVQPFNAAGSATDVLLGSMYTSSVYVTEHRDPVTRLRLALRAAHYARGDVRPPFYVISYDPTADDYVTRTFED